MTYATNVDAFFVVGPVNTTTNLNSAWWSTYTISGSAVLQKKGGSGAGGSDGNAGTTSTGTAAAFYKFSGIQNDQSIIIQGIRGLASGGTVHMYARSTNSGTPTGYRATIKYLAGNLAYTIETILNGVPTTIASLNSTTPYVDTGRPKYQFIVTGTSIKIRYAATGALADALSATNATYTSGTLGIGIVENVGNFTLNYDSVTVDGANLAQSNFINMFT